MVEVVGGFGVVVSGRVWDVIEGVIFMVSLVWVMMSVGVYRIKWGGVRLGRVCGVWSLGEGLRWIGFFSFFLF